MFGLQVAVTSYYVINWILAKKNDLFIKTIGFKVEKKIKTAYFKVYFALGEIFRAM